MLLDTEVATLWEVILHLSPGNRKIFNRGLRTCLFLIFLCSTEEERGRIKKGKLKEMVKMTNFCWLFLSWAGSQNLVPWTLCGITSYPVEHFWCNFCVFLNNNFAFLGTGESNEWKMFLSSHPYTSSARISLTSLRAFICSPVTVLMQIMFLPVTFDVFLPPTNK